MKLQKMKMMLASAALIAAAPASANVITLDFEGVGNLNSVDNFYNGGAGTNYGIQFSPATLALVDADAGGSGNFANEPTANTIMFFLDASNAILNYAAGFTTGFSFFYTSSTAASVNVYDGLNGTGNLLASLGLSAQYSNSCAGDPSGSFCNWSTVGVNFSGTAKSIDFGGTANQTGFDNITFGSATAGQTGGETPSPSAVPLPAALPLLLSGLGVLGFATRRRKEEI